MNRALRERIKQLDADPPQDTPRTQPCGILDEFYTKCYHARNCTVSWTCSLAVPGTGQINRDRYNVQVQ